jgi:carbamate kinase
VRIVVALGGNALLERGEALNIEHQRTRIRCAAQAIAPLADAHELLISHGNGPQVGLLALQGLSHDPATAWPLDILGAETDGMIGYLIEQELAPLLGEGKCCATLLTRIEVDANDPAFAAPTKFVGPVYPRSVALALAREHAWQVARDGDAWRRVVPSPRPQRIVNLPVIELLVNNAVVVVCAGGGGIPVARNKEGVLCGMDAVIDKDLASALLAREFAAQALLILTDVDAIYDDWGSSAARAIRRISASQLRERSFAAGSMAPKVLAACEYVEASGGVAAIGRLQDAARLLSAQAGTLISAQQQHTQWWSP